MRNDRNVIHQLNTDVLLQIFEHLLSAANGGLRSLSMTCWAMREAVIPVLFRYCNVLVKEPLNEDRFVPRSLWPYITTLSLVDKCPDMVAMRSSYRSRELTFANDRLLCGTMCAAFLKDSLQAMPLLRSVSLTLYHGEIHGIGWDSVAAILSTPQLRSFTVRTFLLCPREPPPETWVGTLAPITTFRYEQPSNHSYLFAYPTQQDSLAFVLTRLRSSLESIALPSEITPVAVLSQVQWPQLRELSLCGEFHLDTGYMTPLISLFFGMPRLRVLNLKFSLYQDVDRKQLIMWPEGYESHLPWPDLESLTVSFPDPGDHVYSRLPPSLRRLSLRCTPHHCLHRDRSPYCHSPLLSASEMLDILTRICTPLLYSLQLEYRADDAEDDLLQMISDNFPDVQCLEIHRFRASDDENVHIRNVAQRLATLRSLHTLRAHLELPKTTLQLPLKRQERGYSPEVAGLLAEADFLGLCWTATILRSELPQPNLKIWLLQRETFGARWRLFRQVINQDAGEQPQEEFDPADGQGTLVRGFQ